MHPDGPLYVGDLVSFEVLAPPGFDSNGRSVTLQTGATSLAPPDAVTFAAFGIGDRQQATLTWAWDTSFLQPGPQVITFTLQPTGPTWTQTITLLPGGQVPAPEPQANWAMARSQCCVLHYITGTAAERDLSELLAMVDEQARRASQKMQVEINQPIPIVFLPRVLGHGGFTTAEIAVSYLDRKYAGGELEMVLQHELVHYLDIFQGGDVRPAMLVEGVAVYQSGGHFKPESLLPRAAALLPPQAGCAAPGDASSPIACGLDRYIPLQALVENFYAHQHEIGYLEAGALVAYMVERWGWSAFFAFYRAIQAASSSSQALDATLQSQFGLDLSQLEADFLSALQRQELEAAQVQDVRLSVEFYDTARRYQQRLDPSAHFLTAWLPDPQPMRQRGIVADYLRRPLAPENLALESMLVEADEALRAGDYPGAGRLLQAANQALDEWERLPGREAFSVSPLALDYYELVQAVQATGYQPERVQVKDDAAQVWASYFSPDFPGPQLLQLRFLRANEGWSGGFEVLYHGQGEKIRLNGGVQYRFMASKMNAPTTTMQAITSNRPQPRNIQVRVRLPVCSSSSS
jgi:hypothetical protein